MQALRGEPGKRLVAVTYFGSTASEEDTDRRKKKFQNLVEQQLDLDQETNKQLVVVVSSAKSFLNDGLTLEAMTQHFPQEESLFEEVTVRPPE